MCEAQADLGTLGTQVDQTKNSARVVYAFPGFVYNTSDESKAAVR